MILAAYTSRTVPQRATLWYRLEKIRITMRKKRPQALDAGGARPYPPRGQFTRLGGIGVSYLATCTFDLKGASTQDYQTAYADLEKTGLKKVVESGSGGKVVAPTTMTIGEFNGQSAAAVRDF